ncbi:DUF2946 family protein [Ideonella alba]|uniref:DUF2946 family protein n=1 Tax=Ideonella alba TaxID=2824118 RepID=A0A941BII7_9BURK|nr:DUF2946 family protein [Ideonella alba]MBQ0932763.1 DUF2946 family protein [Ideonella alba]
MLHHLRHRLAHAALLAWMALFGLLAAPTVSRSLAAVDPIAYAAVCSAAGSTDAASSQGQAHAGEACGLCAVAALPIVPVVGGGSVAVPRFTAVLAEPVALPSRQVAWRIARSRAPPLLT